VYICTYLDGISEDLIVSVHGVKKNKSCGNISFQNTILENTIIEA
jgi:hypothetical protein